MYDPSALTMPAMVPGEHDANPPQFRLTQTQDPDFSPWRESGQGLHGLTLGCRLLLRDEARLGAASCRSHRPRRQHSTSVTSVLTLVHWADLYYAWATRSTVDNQHQAIPIGVFRARLAEMIRRAERGEEVVIARGGEPVAKLVRLKSTRRQLGVLKQWLSDEDLGVLGMAIERPLSAADQAALAGETTDILGLSTP